MLDFRGIVELLESRGFQALAVTLGHRNLPLSRLEGVEWAKGEGLWNGGPFVTFVLDFDAGSPEPLFLEWGFGRERLLQASAILLFGFAAPVLLTLGYSRRMLSHPAGATDLGAWFSYWRYLNVLSIGCYVLWFVLLVGVSADDIVDALLPSGGIAEIGGFLVVGLLPPFAASALSQMLSAPVLDHLHGRSGVGSRVVRASILGGAFLVLPPVLGLLSLVALFRDPRLGALGLAAAFLMRVVLARLLMRDDDFTPLAVTVGELRDRTFQLAKRLGVRVKQLYVVPAVETRMAYAFAAHGGNLVLTDFLLRRLDKREVDAIVAHELSHLRHRHPILLLLGLVVVGASVPITILSFERLGLSLVPLWFQVLAGVIAAFLLYLLLSRRFELTADTDAVLLTNDPEGMISAIAKLTRANLLPRAWGRWSGWFLTHPSLEERARVIAERSDVSRERVAELLATDEEEELYAFPRGAGAAPVFSTKFKSANLLRITFAILAAATLPPLGVALVAAPLGSPLPWAVYALGVPLCLLVMEATLDRAVMFGHSVVRRRLKAKLAAENLESERGLFVAYAPDREPRVYEGYFCWDFGFVFFESDRLVYLGDRASFEIPRGSIVDVAVVKGSPSWTPIDRVGLRVAAPQGRERDVAWTVGDCSTATGSRKETARLARRIEEWRAGATSETTVVTRDQLPLPPADQVTSELPAATVSPLRILSSLLFFATGAVLACALARLPLADGGWYVIALAAGAVLAQAFPVLRGEARPAPDRGPSE